MFGFGVPAGGVAGDACCAEARPEAAVVMARAAPKILRFIVAEPAFFFAKLPPGLNDF